MSVAAEAAGDLDLVRQARDGAAEALEALYRRHCGRVYALCLRMTADERRAEELTQDVWVRVWRKIGTFREESAFTTWLHRVTTNVVLQSERGHKRRRKRIRLVDDLSPYDPGAESEPTETRLTLERAIATLPERARVVFVLHDVEGRTHREVAEILDVAEGTSKAHLHRARRMLRERLSA